MEAPLESLGDSVEADPGRQDRSDDGHEQNPYIPGIHVSHTPSGKHCAELPQASAQYFATTGPPNLKSRPIVTTE